MLISSFRSQSSIEIKTDSNEVRRLVSHENSSLMTSLPLNRVKVLTPSQIETSLREKRGKGVFPRDFIISNFEPFELIAANYPIITKELNCSFAESGDEESANISISQVGRVYGGINCDINFYGRDSTMLVAHIMKHLILLNHQLTSDNHTIYINIFTHHEIDLKHASSILQDSLQTKDSDIQVTEKAFMFGTLKITHSQSVVSKL